MRKKNKLNKKVLVNVEENEIRVAFLENGYLVDLFIEKTDSQSHVGNLYKGIVEDVVPGLRAAFIDIGFDKRAFLHFDDFCLEALNPAQRNKKSFLKRLLDLGKKEEENEKKSNNKPFKLPSDPAKILQKGQNILVQVIKDEIGTKGPRVSTNIAIPGRYLVLLPYPSQKGGISRKIDDEKERQRLRRILGKIKSSQRSFIIRTAGKGANDESIKSDIGHLKKVWGSILRKFRKNSAPQLVYNDHDIIYRIARDNFTEDLDEIILDDVPSSRQLKKILRLMIPCLMERVHVFSSPLSIFKKYDVEKQIRKACDRKVWLKHGAYVVFDETEALTAIDVNSGRFTGKKDQEKMALKTNLNACRVIAQQLRLRDIGGIVVIDFIDMKPRDNQINVEKEFRRQMRSDRAKKAILPISEFGLLELTRKRVRQSLGHQIFDKCPYCGGSGRVLAPNQIWRQMKYSIMEILIQTPKPSEITVVMHPRTKNYIHDKLQKALDEMQKKYKVSISLLSSEDLHIEDFQVRYALPGGPSGRGQGSSQKK